MELINLDDVKKKIITLRGLKVILDSDVAMLYGVETMRVNEAVKNNPDKFPEGYVFVLSQKEKQEVIEIFDNLKIKFSPTFPKAFTEKGLYMLATILKSPQATNTTIAIVEAFANIKELSRTIAALSQSTEESQQKTLMQKSGDIIEELFGSELTTTDSETCLELNFALFKVKHTVRRRNERETL